MQKQIHVNSYIKRDGTQVKEHFRNISTDNFGTLSIVPEDQNGPVLDEQNHNPLENIFPNIFEPTMGINSTPVLKGSVSKSDIDWGNIGSIFGNIGGAIGSVIAVGMEVLPIALQMCEAVNNGSAQAIKYLQPQFDTKIKQLDTQVAQIKTNIDTSVKKLANTKTQTEYNKIYELLQKDWQAYQSAKNIVDRIKVHAINNDFQSVANELGNFTNHNQKRIISDLLQQNVKLKNNINNAKDFINKYHLDDKFKYALSHNTSGINRSADFSDYGNENIKINNFLNRNRQNTKEMANIFLAKPQNIPLSKEYSYIPKGYANILNYKYKLFGTNKEIPQNWEGIVFNQYSALSKNVSNSIEMQNKIREQFNIMQADTLNNKLEVEFSKDSNLHLSIGHATVLEPYIDSQGYFHGILFDKYDFNNVYLKYYSNLKTTIVNNYFWVIQHEAGHNYYILAPILFKW